MTIGDAVRWTRRKLTEAGVETAAFEARQLTAAAFSLSPDDLFLRGEDPAAAERVSRLEEMCDRRLAGEPLQYILGEWEFYGLPFYVGPGVLIPRPDTELLVERALEALPSSGAEVLELCAGSGCISIALAKARPDCRFVALEKSPAAYRYLMQNMRRNGADNVTPVLGDLFEGPPALPSMVSSFACIVSNPPYIPSGELMELDREVQREPAMALDGGGDGLDFYRAICRLWLSSLRPGGCLLVEIGRGQEREVVDLLQEAGLENMRQYRDLNGIYRVIKGTLPS